MARCNRRIKYLQANRLRLLGKYLKNKGVSCAPQNSCECEQPTPWPAELALWSDYNRTKMICRQSTNMSNYQRKDLI